MKKKNLLFGIITMAIIGVLFILIATGLEGAKQGYLDTINNSTDQKEVEIAKWTVENWNLIVGLAYTQILGSFLTAIFASLNFKLDNKVVGIISIIGGLFFGLILGLVFFIMAYKDMKKSAQ